MANPYPSREFIEIKNNADTATIVERLNRQGEEINHMVGSRNFGPAPYVFHSGIWYTAVGPMTHGCGVGHPLTESTIFPVGQFAQFRDEFIGGVFHIEESYLLTHIGVPEQIQSADVDAPPLGQTYQAVLLAVENYEDFTWIPTEVIAETGVGTLGATTSNVLHDISPDVILEPGDYCVGLITNASETFTWSFPVKGNQASEGLEGRSYGGAFSRQAVAWYLPDGGSITTAADLLTVTGDDSDLNQYYPLIGCYGRFLAP